MKLHLDSNIIEGTPEEIVEYLRLVEGNSSDNQLTTYGHAHQPDEECTEPTEESEDESQEPSTELQVGDRVKVLKSEGGAEGEAKVTAVLEDGDVELAGTNREGEYSTNWSNHVSNLEKIEEDIIGYTFWYVDGSTFNNRNVLKVTLEGHFEDSKGRRYSHLTMVQKAVHGLVKPLDREDVREKFEKAKHSGSLLKYYPALDVFIRE